MDGERGGNRILFGRYTGLTPVSGHPDSDQAVQRMRRALRGLATESRAVLEQIATNPNVDRELQYYFPNINGGEMWGRWDMQLTPPDVLITNYSMLNIMLMRRIEESIFDRTRNWLQANHDNVFFLVVDELHAYRGTPGTEVAYILRLLVQRLGLDRRPDQLRILATSASAGDGNETLDFLHEFFGRDAGRFQLISGEQVPPSPKSKRQIA
jgi:ATP-dependent helicase YprA (DUF1998 family)